MFATSGRRVVAVFVVSTHEGGKMPETSEWFARWAREAAYDERTGWMYLKHVQFAVFGCGNKEYGDNFNRAGRELDGQLARMGAERLARRCDGDESSGRMEMQFEEWSEKVIRRLSTSRLKQDSDIQNVNIGAVEVTDGMNFGGDEYVSDNDADEVISLAGSEDDQDMEDMGENENGEKREMVTDALRGALTKQGYKILGSHSGVKLCRWTKAMLRGRGGCYKHTFYGIESHRCMETTPSLACANKCTFCWRHHTNPVGKTWRWQMDDPLELVEAAVSEHCKMVKQMKGVPGVLPEKLIEGMNPRHCALSLVGEPIMYPEIGKFVNELHSRKISTFLVTNAQFPEAITNLPPITQLYVSVDAATPETLKAIDRPLFSDYWDRFIGSLTALKDKQQRTVYRLTLVSGWNMEEVAAYAKLVDLGKPDFIEIKGVTYCGSSDASSLTMKNVPYHKDVCEFGEAIVNLRRGEDGAEEYGLACEHAHSCCILLARTSKYKINGEWHTWIDYDKFQELVARGEKFTAADYMERTPPWAIYGAEEAGFDPEQMRVKKVRNHPGKPEQIESIA
jgi:tRNA wybutosine-synthesizing protein 1